MTAPAPGLTSAEAAERLVENGPNDPAPPRRRSAALELLAAFANPLAVTLVLAAAVSAIVGDLVDAAIVIVILALGAALNFAQTFRSQRAADRLRAAVAPTATVLRDGQWRELPRAEIVPGDVIRLSAGDLVPADAKLVDSRDLHVQQAALTGESLPVEKMVGGDGAEHGPDAPDLVFVGSSVVSGTATARVVATGTRTVFGDIAARLAKHPPESEFERGLRQFGAMIMRVVFSLVLVIMVISVALHRPPLESLMFAVALAVGLTPEFLPMITSVTLAKGAVRMSRAKVIVKHLSAIQNFGSIDVLCSDKTGTLTAGKMSLIRVTDARGEPADEPRALAAMNSRFETGIKSPLDAAILEASRADRRAAEKRDEIPFDFERRCVSVVVDTEGRRLMITKGAPEAVLARVAYMDENGQRVAFGDAAREAASRVHDAMGADGLRVLAVAYRELAHKDAYGKEDETELVLAGYLAFADPPLPEARAAIAALAKDGVTVKILTGDSELVARHVCREVGLDVAEIVQGDAIDKMGDPALAHVAERVTVFARMSPAQKSRVIHALKRRSHVVGFLGDGVNDAPSLHDADVGISVFSAVDAARDAASIILLERGLTVLHLGILEGRKAFGNVTKYILMGTSSNFGNMFSMAAASLVLPFLPMLPTQVLLNNLLYDLAQVTIPTDRVDPAYVRKPQRWDVRTIRRFMLLIGPVSSAYDFLTFFVLLRVFHADEALFHTGWFVESLATQTLVLFVIRTRDRPWKSRPSRALAATTLAVVAVGIALPFTPAAAWLGFVPLPPAYFAFLAAATATYLALVELVKRRVLPA